jgi:hypothetical protein
MCRGVVGHGLPALGSAARPRQPARATPFAHHVSFLRQAPHARGPGRHPLYPAARGVPASGEASGRGWKRTAHLQPADLRSTSSNPACSLSRT